MDAFKNLADLGKHKSVKSELYGVLEMPGFKGFPSKNQTLLTGRDNNLNPDQGVFEIKTALVRHKLSNGRLWNEYGKELPFNTFDKSPHVKQPFPLSEPTGALGVDRRATNPEMITGFGMLPYYPEEERIKAMLDLPRKPIPDSVFTRKIYQARPKLFDAQEVKQKAETHREKFSADRLNRLAHLGFSEETIGKAIQEEAQRDVLKALQNPGLFNEAEISAAIQDTYEKWVTRRNMVKTGENAAGIGGASSIQNPGVTANNAFVAVASGGQLPTRSGLARIRAELMKEGLKAKREHYFGGLSENASGDGSIADVLAGVASGIGTGPGGETSFARAGIEGIEVRRRRGRPLGLKESEETKLKRRETIARKKQLAGMAAAEREEKLSQFREAGAAAGKAASQKKKDNLTSTEREIYDKYKGLGMGEMYTKATREGLSLDQKMKEFGTFREVRKKIEG